MCERTNSTKYKVSVYQHGQYLGSSYHWDKPSANRTFEKQNRKQDTTVVMFSPQGHKIRG